MDLQLKDKVAVITGSSKGIGFAVARALAQEGVRLSLSGRNPQTLETCEGELRALGAQTLSTCGDLLQVNAIESLVERTVSHFGALNLLVCNLGGTAGGSFAKATAADWRATLEVNLVHSLRAIQAAVPHFEAAGGGAVVVVSSISGFKPGPRAQYGAAKAAQIQMVSSLQRELAPKNIRLNTVSPGSILFDGGRWAERQATMPEKLDRFVASEFPFGRMGTLEEVANVVTFLLSDRSRWVAGSNVVVDGAQGRPSIDL